MSRGTVERKKITELKQDPDNANDGTERGLSMLGDSLSNVGLGRGVLMDKNGILLAGNKTQESAVDHGFEDAIIVHTNGRELVVTQRDDLDLLSEDPKERERARRAAYYDNRVGQIDLSWNPAQILRDSQNPDLNGIVNTMFSEKELTDILNKLEGSAKEPFYKPPKHDNKEAEAAQEKWKVEVGQVWHIASMVRPGVYHRMMCGDSRTDLPKLMGSDHATLLVTSPPYCVNKDYEAGMGVEEWKELIRDVFKACKPFADTWFVNLANRLTGNDGYELNTFGDMVNMFGAMDVPMIALRIWTKPASWLLANPYWRHTYKPVDEYEFLGLFGVKPKYKNRLTDDENTDWGYRGLWAMGSVSSNGLQSARFPIELPTRAIRMLSDFGDTILEPFSGSGTTIAAGEAVGRRVLAMEKEAQDVAAALEVLTEQYGFSVEKE